MFKRLAAARIEHALGWSPAVALLAVHGEAVEALGGRVLAAGIEAVGEP